MISFLFESVIFRKDSEFLCYFIVTVIFSPFLRKRVCRKMPDNEEKDVRTLFEEIKQGRN